MNELVKTEKLFGGNKVLLGTPNADLVLQTLGKVYIQSGKNIKLLSDIIKEISKADASKVTISNNDNTSFRSNGQLIFNKDNQTLYLGIDGLLVPIVEAQSSIGNYVKKSGDTMSGTLYLSSDETPLKIKSNQLVSNLNAEYLNGNNSEAYLQKNKNEVIKGKWEYQDNQLFRKKIIVDDKIGSDTYQSGFNGYGWQLDSETNTLTIDNLIVRKILKVYELVINKISATNGSLWITNSAKIKSIYLLDTHISEDQQFYIDNGSYQYNGNNYSGNYLHTKYGNFALTDLDSPNTYVLNFLNLNINKCNDNFETTGEYTSINVYEQYFKKYQSKATDNLYIIETDQPTFAQGDLIKCQKFDGVNTVTYNLLVLHILWGTGSGQMCLVQIDSSINKIQPEDVLVQYGNLTNRDRQGSYYITSSEENSPYSLIISGANNPDYQIPYKTPIFDSLGQLQADSNNKYLYEYVKPIKVRIGKLDGQWDNYYLDSNGKSLIKGWGLYGQNVFLTGEFHLNNGMSVVDYTKEGILLNFKNAGLEIKEISPGINGIILNGNQIQINTIDASGNTIQTALFKDGYISAELIKAFKLESNKKINGVSAWALNEDGSGHLAGKGITWDEHGNITFKGKLITDSGEIAGIKINSTFLGIEEGPKCMYLSEEFVGFYTESVRSVNGEPENQDVRIGTRPYPAGMLTPYIGLFNDTYKTINSKHGININIQNSCQDNTAISISGGCIEGVRFAIYNIEDNTTILPKDKNYIYYNLLKNKEVILPNVNRSDFGLTYFIRNINPIENDRDLKIKSTGSTFTTFTDPFHDNNIETETKNTCFLYYYSYDSSHTPGISNIIKNRITTHEITLYPGDYAIITLSNRLNNNELVWTAQIFRL